MMTFRSDCSLLAPIRGGFFKHSLIVLVIVIAFICGWFVGINKPNAIDELHGLKKSEWREYQPGKLKKVGKPVRMFVEIEQ